MDLDESCTMDDEELENQTFDDEDDNDEYFDKDFEDNNESNWSDDDINLDLDTDYSELCILRQTTDSSYISSNNDHKMDESVPLSTKSRAQTPSIQYWSCSKCNQLNNLKDTFSKYDMKCFRCDALYEIKSNVIAIEEDINDPIITTPQTSWKCPRCTLINPFTVLQCQVCELDKPDDEEMSEDKEEEDTVFVYPVNKKYCDQYSTNLVRGYLRAICNYYLDLHKTQNLCPSHSTIPEVLSIVVLQFYQFCNFWNMEYLSDHWQFEETRDENGNIQSDNKSTLIRTACDHYEWKNAFSLQKVEFLGDYSWTLQIQYVDALKVDSTNKDNKYVRCWIGVMESEHDLALTLRAWNNQLFCSSKFGFGVYGYNGNKMKNDISKPFGKPFKVNDIITIKLQCTTSYYELRYTVNGKDIGNYNAIHDDQDDGNHPITEQDHDNNELIDDHINKNDRVAYRLPNDKVYEMVIALKNSNYKIKCISFQTKPYNLY